MMILALVLVILLVIAIMSIQGNGRVPWAGKLRRLHAGSAQRGEWMAPLPVVERVRSDYIEAINWLHNQPIQDLAQRQVMAPIYLEGPYLKRYQRILSLNQIAREPLVDYVLRATHAVQVRHFSEDGERCLVIDTQLQRRMATYDHASGERIHTQDLGESHSVYQMVYDRPAQRWKIESFVHELPSGWHLLNRSSHPFWAVQPITRARDN